MAAVDLVLREFPDTASRALTQPLDAVATFLASDTTRAYRLWDTPEPVDCKPDDYLSHTAWAERVRRAAGRGLTHIADLTEPTWS